MTHRVNTPIREVVPETDVDVRRAQLNDVANQIYVALLTTYPDIDMTTLPDGTSPPKDRWEANEIWNKVSKLTDDNGHLYVTLSPDLIGASPVVTAIFDTASLAWSAYSAGGLTIGGGWNTLPPQAEYPLAPGSHLPDLRTGLSDLTDPPPFGGDAA